MVAIERVFETIVEINQQGTTILLVEQNAMMALEAASRGYFLETARWRSRTTRRRFSETTR
jgi:branched-chain amino acid transport system ATP-binding protein